GSGVGVVSHWCAISDRRPKMRRRLGGSPIKFVVVGVGNTLLGLTIIYALKGLAGASDVAANVVGYLVGASVSFSLNKTWTFGHRGRVGPALWRFLLVLAAAYML